MYYSLRRYLRERSTPMCFFAWLSQDLLPKLPTNSVIVMDNAPFHKRANFQHLIEQQGHLLEFLPPYSPDLNPIEQQVGAS